MTHTGAKGQGQRSLSSIVIVQADGQTDGRTKAIALRPVLRRSVTGLLRGEDVQYISGQQSVSP